MAFNEHKVVPFTGGIKDGFQRLFAQKGRPKHIDIPTEGLTGLEIKVVAEPKARGQVLDESGRPVVGAVVAVVDQGDSVRTDESGRFEIVLQPSRPAWASMAAGGRAMSDDPNKIRVQAFDLAGVMGVVQTVDRDTLARDNATLTVYPVSRVSVRVQDRQGKPLAGAHLELRGRYNRDTLPLTDKHGEVNSIGLYRGGEYAVNARLDGYRAPADIVIGSPGQAGWKGEVVIVMDKAGPALTKPDG